METAEARSGILEAEIHERGAKAKAAVKAAELKVPTLLETVVTDVTVNTAADSTGAASEVAADADAPSASDGTPEYAKGLDQSVLRSIFIDGKAYKAMLHSTVNPEGLQMQYNSTLAMPSGAKVLEGQPKVYHNIQISPIQVSVKGEMKTALVLSQTDRSQLVELEKKLEEQVDMLEVQLHEAQSKFERLSNRERYISQSLDNGEISDKGEYIDTLDTMVRGGMLRGMFQLAMDDDKNVARKAKKKITRFLKYGAGVLPKTAGEAKKAAELEAVRNLEFPCCWGKGGVIYKLRMKKKKRNTYSRRCHLLGV